MITFLPSENGDTYSGSYALTKEIEIRVPTKLVKSLISQFFPF